MSTPNTSTPRSPRAFIESMKARIRKTVQKIRASEPLEPIVTKLLERPVQALWLAIGIGGCITVSVWANDLIRAVSLQIPIQAIFVMLLINAFVNIAVLPLSSSFRSLLSLHSLGLALSTSFLLLTVTNSSFLTVCLGGVFAIVGFERSTREQQGGDSSVWHHTRLVITILFLFIAVGRYVFEYSSWLYEYRLWGISLLRTKDVLSEIAVGLIFAVSLLQSLFAVVARFRRPSGDGSALPPWTGWIELLRKLCGKGADKLVNSPVPYNSNLFARLPAAGKKVGLLGVGVLLKLFQIPLLILLILVGTAGYAVSIISPRNIRATLSGLLPISFVATSVALAVRLGSVVAQYPNLGPEMQIEERGIPWLLICGVAMAAIFASVNFRAFHLPKVTKVEARHQRLEQIVVCIFVWPFFFTVGIFLTQWCCHGKIDSLSSWWLICQLALIAALWISHELLTRKSTTTATTPVQSHAPAFVAASLIIGVVVVVLFSTASWAHPALLGLSIALLIALGLVSAAVESKDSRWKTPIFIIASLGGIASILIAVVLGITHFPSGAFNAARGLIQHEIIAHMSQTNGDRVSSSLLTKRLHELRAQLMEVWEGQLTLNESLHDTSANVLPSVSQSSLPAAEGGVLPTHTPSTVILKAVAVDSDATDPTEPRAIDSAKEQQEHEQARIESALRTLQSATKKGLRSEFRPDPADLKRIYPPDSDQSINLDFFDESQLRLFGIQRLVLALKVSGGHDEANGYYVGLIATHEGDLTMVNKVFVPAEIEPSKRKVRRVPDTERWRQLALSLWMEVGRLVSQGHDIAKASNFDVIVYFSKGRGLNSPLGFRNSEYAWLGYGYEDKDQKALPPTIYSYAK